MAASLIAGALGVLVVAPLVRNVLYGATAFDPMTLGLSVAVLIASATLALVIPLGRAIRVNLAVALRP